MGSSTKKHKSEKEKEKKKKRSRSPEKTREKHRHHKRHHKDRKRRVEVIETEDLVSTSSGSDGEYFFPTFQERKATKVQCNFWLF